MSRLHVRPGKGVTLEELHAARPMCARCGRLVDAINVHQRRDRLDGGATIVVQCHGAEERSDLTDRDIMRIHGSPQPWIELGPAFATHKELTP